MQTRQTICTMVVNRESIKNSYNLGRVAANSHAAISSSRFESGLQKGLLRQL
jgi:hypothetical protein